MENIGNISLKDHQEVYKTKELGNELVHLKNEIHKQDQGEGQIFSNMFKVRFN